MQAIGKRSVASLLGVFLNVSWYVVGLGIGLAAFIVVISLLGDMRNTTMDIPVSFGMNLHTLDVAAPSLGIEKATLRNVHGSANLTFPPPSRIFLAATGVSVMIVLGLVLWVLGEIRAVFRTLSDGQPFVAANAPRLRRIGYVVIFGELARATWVFAGNYYTISRFSADDVHFDLWPSLNILAILAGLIIVVIAEVFRQGTRLDEEQSLTV